MKYTLLLALLALFTMAAAYQFPTVNASVLAAHLCASLETALSSASACLAAAQAAAAPAASYVLNALCRIPGVSAVPPPPPTVAATMLCFFANIPHTVRFALGLAAAAAPPTPPPTFAGILLGYFVDIPHTVRCALGLAVAAPPTPPPTVIGTLLGYFANTPHALSHMFGLDAALPAAAKMHALLVVVAALMFFAASWLGPRLRAEMLIGRLDSHGSDLRQIGVVMYEQHTAIAQLREDIESLQKLLSVELSDMNSRDERIAACSKTIDTLVRQMDTVIMSIKQM